MRSVFASGASSNPHGTGGCQKTAGVLGTPPQPCIRQTRAFGRESTLPRAAFPRCPLRFCTSYCFCIEFSADTDISVTLGLRLESSSSSVLLLGWGLRGQHLYGPLESVPVKDWGLGAGKLIQLFWETLSIFFLACNGWWHLTQVLVAPAAVMSSKKTFKKITCVAHQY